MAQAQTPPTPLQRLEASILRTTRSINATWGIYVKSLETGDEIAIDADRQMETMSTIKIPLMIEAFEQIKAGKFKLTDKYTFVEADSQPGTGTIQRLDYGAVMTVKDLHHDDDHRVGQYRDRSAVPHGRRAGRRERAHADARPEDDAGDERPVEVVPGAARRTDDRTVLSRRQVAVRLLDPARDGPAARDDGARHAGRQAVVGPHAPHHARTALSHADPALRHGLHDPAQDRRLPALRGRRRRACSRRPARRSS